MNLADLRTLGRSGLPVSPMALGTMTMGNTQWGSHDDASATIFDAYVEAGGNFVDTADVYAAGRSEELVGRFIAGRNLRDRVVLATKYSWNGDKGNPIGGGNGRKNLHRALDGSLRRLGTDYIDLYWMHVWDQVTPVEEVVQALGDLVRAGKIRYYGLSDVPAWYLARAATLAEAWGIPGPIALQPEYSLVERSIEREHVPACRELGLGITPWSPLAFGFLSGKYSRDESGTGGTGEGRLKHSGPMAQKFSERNWAILDAVRGVAEELGRSMAQVALAWAATRPGITSVIVGASRVEQLRDNLGALDVALPPELAARLDAATALEPVHPYAIFAEPIQRSIFAGASVRPFR